MGMSNDSLKGKQQAPTSLSADFNAKPQRLASASSVASREGPAHRGPACRPKKPDHPPLLPPTAYAYANEPRSVPSVDCIFAELGSLQQSLEDSIASLRDATARSVEEKALVLTRHVGLLVATEKPLLESSCSQTDASPLEGHHNSDNAKPSHWTDRHVREQVAELLSLVDRNADLWANELVSMSHVVDCVHELVNDLHWW